MDNKMNQVLWTDYFLDVQGYFKYYQIIHQYNKNFILLEKNGKFSSTRNIYHIAVWYYFITDCLKWHQDLRIKYYPMGKISGDYFTKSLSGSQFRKICELILGIDNNKIPQYTEEYHGYIGREIENIVEIWRPSK